MDISSVISSSAIQSGSLFTSNVRPVFALLGTSATTDSGTLGASTIVDLSELGRLLSASLAFQIGVSESGSQTSFSTIVAATQLFTGAFNSFLQSDELHNSSGGSLGNLFVQTLDSQTASGSGKSLLASLSEAGINYQSPLNQNDAGQLTIDFQLLQSAFNADPAGTLSLLAEAAQSVGQLAAKFVSLLTPLDNPAEIGTLQNLPDTTTPTGLSETGIPSPSSTETTATAGTTTEAATAVSTGATTAAATGATTAPSTLATAVIENRATAAATGEVTTGATTATTNMATTGVTAGTATVASPPTTIGVTSSATTAASISEVTIGTTPTVTTGAAAGATTAASTIATAGVASQATTVASTDEVISGTTASTTNVATAEVTAGTIINATPGMMAESTIAATTGVAPGTTIAATAGIPTGTTTDTPTSSAIPVTPATNAINPAIVAAIAAYHLDEGIFDNTKAIDARFVSVTSSTIPPVMPVAPTQPAKLDIYT